jgi:hypothetical protein
MRLIRRLAPVLALAVAATCVAAPTASAKFATSSGPTTSSSTSTATITAVFDADLVTITSSKGISNFVLVDCDGNVLFKHDFNGPELRVITLRLGDAVGAVWVKAGTTVEEFARPGACDDTPPPCELEDIKDGTCVEATYAART